MSRMLAGIAWLCTSLVVTSAARAQAEEFVPFEPTPPAATSPAPEPQAPQAAPPASTPEPAQVPLADEPSRRPPPVRAEPKKGLGLPDPVVWLAQYATACLVPMLAGNLAVVPLVGQLLVLLLPAANGFLVQLVGDTLSGRTTSPIAPIVGAYVGQLCVVPACTIGGVGTFLGLYLGGALGFIYGTTTTRRFDPLTLGAWLGLGLAGGVVLIGSVLGGLAVSAALPVVAYNVFAVDDAATPAPSSSAPAAKATPVRAAPAAVAGLAY